MSYTDNGDIEYAECTQMYFRVSTMFFTNFYGLSFTENGDIEYTEYIQMYSRVCTFLWSFVQNVAHYH